MEAERAGRVRRKGREEWGQETEDKEKADRVFWALKTKL